MFCGLTLRYRKTIHYKAAAACGVIRSKRSADIKIVSKMKKIPKEIEAELLTIAEDSYRQGVSVRRRNVIQIGLCMAFLIVVLCNIDGISDAVMLSIVISSSSLGIIWGVLSMSASLNMQIDVISRLFVHYSECQKVHGSTNIENGSDRV